jgi:ABC-type cobalt transport system substrate-binding protein
MLVEEGSGGDSSSAILQLLHEVGGGLGHLPWIQPVYSNKGEVGSLIWFTWRALAVEKIVVKKSKWAY